MAGYLAFYPRGGSCCGYWRDHICHGTSRCSREVAWRVFNRTGGISPYRWGKNAKLTLRGLIPLGAASGILSAVLGTVGPFAAPFFLSYGLIKGSYIGTEAMTAVFMHLTKLGVYGSYALIGIRTLLIGVAIGAVMILGTFLGKRLLNKIPDHIFPYIIEGTMLIAGIIFLVRG